MPWERKGAVFAISVEGFHSSKARQSSGVHNQGRRKVGAPSLIKRHGKLMHVRSEHGSGRHDHVGSLRKMVHGNIHKVLLWVARWIVVFWDFFLAASVVQVA